MNADSSPHIPEPGEYPSNGDVGTGSQAVKPTGLSTPTGQEEQETSPDRIEKVWVF